MKNKLILSCIGMLLLAVSCSTPELELVEYDDSYSPDKNVITVDKPKQFNYDPSNFVAFTTGNEVQFSALLEDGNTMLNNADIKIGFKLKRALASELSFVYEPDMELLKSYTGSKIDYKELPADKLEGLSFTIPAGVMEYETTLHLANMEGLNQKPGYLSAFRLKPAVDTDELKISSSSVALYVKLNVSSLISGANISRVNTLEDGWSQVMPNEITPQSQPNVSDLGAMFDGNQNNLWYTDRDYSVILKFAKRKIGGIRIHNGTQYDEYNYTGVTVSASDDGGATFYNQGNINNPSSNKTTVVKLDKPVNVDCIKLDFTGRGFIVISEIEPYSVQ